MEICKVERIERNCVRRKKVNCVKNANDIYIENLNNEFSFVDDVNPEVVYNDFAKFVQNKAFFRALVNSGGFTFEYICYTEIIKNSVWEDGIVSIIKTYRNAKNKNSEGAIAWLRKCCKEFDLAGEKWTLKARNLIETKTDRNRLDIVLNNTMEYIGGVIEGVIKPYICFVNGCFFIDSGKVANSTLDLGVMVQNIINKDAAFSVVYHDMFGNEKISDWRNVAKHENYLLLVDDMIELMFGQKDKIRKKTLSMESISIIAK